MLRKKLIILTIAVISLGSIAGCSDNTIEDTVEDKSSTVSSDISNKLNEEEEGLKNFLSDIGVDENIVEEKAKTDGGANVIGGAKPARSYSSLGLAQDDFREYLGLHNRIESLKNDIYELTGIFIINKDEFMQAIYSTNNDNDDKKDKVITIKLTKKLSVDDLVEVYFEDGNQVYTEEGEMFGVKYRIYKKDLKSDMYNLAWFTTSNGKSYSVDTKYGLTKNDFEALLDELIWNVITMKEWEEHGSENQSVSNN